MNRNELVPLVLALIAGVLVGAAYFRALWWTVKKGMHARRPAALFIGSFVARTSCVLLVFYFVGRVHPERLAICLLGFILGRLVIVHVAKGSPVRDETLIKTIHAPEP